MFTRECLAIEPGPKPGGVQRSSTCYAGLPAYAGRPNESTVITEASFPGVSLDLWAYANGVVMEFSRPGKPTDNAYIESFNGTLRDACLNVHWFDDLTDAQTKLQAWRQEYNETRPHRSPNELSPLEYKARWAERTSEIH